VKIRPSRSLIDRLRLRQKARWVHPHRFGWYLAAYSRGEIHASVKTVPDLVAYAKEHPGKLSYGSAGVGTGQHIVGEWMKK
jgi:hypothetical protein